MAKKQEKLQNETQPELLFRYVCPKCGKTAIKTSNKMLGVKINCESCGVLFRLDDEKAYKKIK